MEQVKKYMEQEIEENVKKIKQLDFFFWGYVFVGVILAFMVIYSGSLPWPAVISILVLFLALIFLKILKIKTISKLENVKVVYENNFK
jgi:ABC-type bacteriocin/lantibiotic exporter with double-glycine peptidase domain